MGFELNATAVRRIRGSGTKPLGLQRLHDLCGIQSVYFLEPPRPDPVQGVVAGSVVPETQRNALEIRRLLAESVRSRMAGFDLAVGATDQTGLAPDPGSIPRIPRRTSARGSVRRWKTLAMDNKGQPAVQMDHLSPP